MLGQIEAEYYMFADQDDVWLPEKIEKSVRTITEKKEGPQAGEEQDRSACYRYVCDG